VEDLSLSFDDKSGDSSTFLKRSVPPALLKKHSVNILGMLLFFSQPLFQRPFLILTFGTQLSSLA